MASIFKKIFDKGAKRPESSPEGFVEKFDAVKRAIMVAGQNVPERYDSKTPYICGYGLDHNSETKKWLVCLDNSIMLRYHDLDKGQKSGLAVLDLDFAQQSYRLQKAKLYSVPEEAITDFVNMINLYAEPVFMHALHKALEESTVLNLSKKDEVQAAEELKEAKLKPTQKYIID